MMAAPHRLRKHSDYQSVYQASRKHSGQQMSYFFRLRQAASPGRPAPASADFGGARIGLTVSKAMGKAVDRNRIKRRMREAVRRNLALLDAPVDLVLHPRRSVIKLEFATLDREVAAVFRAVLKATGRQAASSPSAQS